MPSAVAGMNCATPRAPAELTAVRMNRLSCQIRLTKKPIGSVCSSAADMSSVQNSSREGSGLEAALSAAVGADGGDASPLFALDRPDSSPGSDEMAAPDLASAGVDG